VSQAGELTEEQKQKVIAHLQAKFAGACPICLTQAWTIGPLVHALPWASGAIALGGGAVPMVVVVCNNCSFVAHFAAVPIGIVVEPRASPKAAAGGT